MPLNHVLYIWNITILPVDFITYFLYLCICLLCIVDCMHNYHSVHIFMVHNGHIVLNCTTYFMYSPLNFLYTSDIIIIIIYY